MEILLVVVAAVVIGFVIYTNMNKAKLDTNKDGKVDVKEAVAGVKAEVKVAEETVKTTVKKAKNTVKKATTKKAKTK